MIYDFKGAKKKGLTNFQISQYLEEEFDYDYTAATNAGISDEQIDEYLTKYELSQERLSAAQAIEINKPSIYEDIVKPTVAEIGDVLLGGIETIAQFKQFKSASLPAGLGVAGLELISQAQDTLIDSWMEGKPVNRFNLELANKKMEEVMEYLTPLKAKTKFGKGSMETLTVPVTKVYEEIEKIEDPEIKAGVKLMGAAYIALTAHGKSPVKAVVKGGIEQINNARIALHKLNSVPRVKEIIKKIEVTAIRDGITGVGSQSADYVSKLSTEVATKLRELPVKDLKRIYKIADKSPELKMWLAETYEKPLWQPYKSWKLKEARTFPVVEGGAFVESRITDPWAFQLLIPKKGATQLKRVGLDRARKWEGWDKTVPIIKQVGIDKLAFNKDLNADIKKFEGGLTPGNYHVEGKIEDLINIKDKDLQINPDIGQRKAKITISDQITEYEQHGQHNAITGDITILAASKEYALNHLAHEAPGHEGDRLLDLPRGANLNNIRLQAEKEVMKLNSEQAKISKQIIEEFPLTMKKRIESLSLIYKTLQEQMDALPLVYEDSYAVYEKSYGEISARDTAARRHLTTKQLQHSRLFDSQEFNIMDVNVVHYNTKTQILNQALKEHRHGNRRKAVRRIEDLKHIVLKLTPEEGKSIESIMPAMTDIKMPKWDSKNNTLTFDDNLMGYLDYINLVNQKSPNVHITKKLYDLIEEKAPIDESRPSKLEDISLTINAQAKKFKDSERGSISFQKKAKPFKFAKNIETRFQKADGISKEPVGQRAKKQLNSFWHQLTREFERLPKTREFADIQFILNRTKKLQGISNYNTIKVLDKLTIALRGKNVSDINNAINLYRRKVIADDLVETLKLNPDAKLPFDFNSITLPQEYTRLIKAIEEAPGIDANIIKNNINKRLRFLEAFTLDYVKHMKTIGKDYSKSFNRKAYFRHQVLDRLQLKYNERLHKGLKVPPSPKFALQRKSETGFDINTNYFEAEGEVISKMLYDIEIVKTINELRKGKYNIAPQVRAKAKEQGIEKWTDAKPTGYVTWQPHEGNVFYTADTIPAQLADKIAEGMATEIGIDPKIVKKAWAKGRKFEEFIVKEEIAETLDTLFKHPIESKAGKASRKILTAWKGYIALSHPKGILKFNIRNMTGDMDAVYIGNPSTFLYGPQAVQELRRGYFKKGELTENLKDFFELGAIDATLLSQELGIGKDLNLAHKFIQQKGGITKIPEKVWKGYWKGARMLSDSRELTLRYAAYLDYLAQMKANNGIPNNFGASIPEEIMGLSNIKHRAFWLSNDLLGAYDRIGEIGQQLRTHLIPFWSWNEVNFTRFNRFIKNASKDTNLQIEMGKGMIDQTYNTKGKWKNFANPARLAKIGKFVLRAMGLWASVQVGNEYVYPEEEKGISKDIRNRPHIVLGKDSKGDTAYFSRIGALGDYLEWFGLDDAPQQYKDFMTGRKTLKEITKDMVLAPVNKVVQGITPLIKVPVEFLTRKTFFPDVISPRIIKDRSLYIAQQLRLAEEYKIIMDMPRKDYDWTKLFLYKSDPDEAAYHDAFDMKRNFLKEKGKSGEGYWISDQGNNLYNMKMAIRYEDKELAEKYFLDYIANGGDPSTLQTTMDTLSPFSNMNKIDLGEFLLSLNSEEQATVKKAYGFYKKNVFKVIDFVKTLDERVIIDVLKSIELPKELSKQEQEKLVNIIKDITGVE